MYDTQRSLSHQYHHAIQGDCTVKESDPVLPEWNDDDEEMDNVITGNVPYTGDSNGSIDSVSVKWKRKRRWKDWYLDEIKLSWQIYELFVIVNNWGSSGFAVKSKLAYLQDPQLRLCYTCTALWDCITQVWHLVDHPGLCSRSHYGTCDSWCDGHSSWCLGLSTHLHQGWSERIREACIVVCGCWSWGIQVGWVDSLMMGSVVMF